MFNIGGNEFNVEIEESFIGGKIVKEELLTKKFYLMEFQEKTKIFL